MGFIQRKNLWVGIQVNEQKTEIKGIENGTFVFDPNEIEAWWRNFDWEFCILVGGKKVVLSKQHNIIGELIPFQRMKTEGTNFVFLKINPDASEITDISGGLVVNPDKIQSYWVNGEFDVEFMLGGKRISTLISVDKWKEATKNYL